MTGGRPLTGYPFFPLRVRKPSDETRVVYNPVTRKEYGISSDAWGLLSLCDGSRSWEEVIEYIGERTGAEGGEVRSVATDFVRRATELGMLWWRREKLARRPAPRPQGVFWDITLECNLRCAHCVVAAGAKKDGELSTSECLTLIDQMPEIGVSSVTFSGGEPLIRADLFQLAQHVRCRGMTAALSSNGTLIDATAAGRMASLGMDVQISIDGSTAAVHDGFRGRPGAFDETLRGAENLRRAGVQFTVGSVLHRSNLFQVGDLLKLSVALGANAFRLIPFITAGRGNSSRHLEPTPQELRAATEYLRDRRQSSPVTITPMEFEFSFAPGCHTAVDSSAQIGCDGARSTFSISATGEVLPCSFFTGARADNVRDRPLAWIWNDSPLLNYVRDMRAVDIHGVCHQCSWFARCLGGCPSANLSRGKMLEPNVRCWVAEELAAAGRTGQ